LNNTKKAEDIPTADRNNKPPSEKSSVGKLVKISEKYIKSETNDSNE